MARSANWITEEIEFEGKLVRIQPLVKGHFDELTTISQDIRIWEYLKHDGLGPDSVISYLEEALMKKEKGMHYPFTIFELKTNRIIGTTRFWKIDKLNRKLEIGWTWIDPRYWSGGYNLEAKFLLLKYCFETLMTIKVSMVTSEDNWRSRTAIEKLGAKLDGVLRKERVCNDTLSRGFAHYSIIDEEWQDIKNQLISKML